MILLGKAPDHTPYNQLSKAQQEKVRQWWRDAGNKTDERNRAAYDYQFKNGECYSAT